MMYRAARLLRHTTYWLLREHGHDLHIENTVRELKPGVEDLATAVDGIIGGGPRELHDSAFAELTAGGVPEKLARRVARLAVLEPALDIVAMARKERQPVAQVARAYFELGVHIGLDWLHREIDRLPVDGSWQATARTGLRDSAMRAHRRAHAAGAGAARRQPAGARRPLEREPQDTRELAAHPRRDARRRHDRFRDVDGGCGRRARPRERLSPLASRARDHDTRAA